MKRLFLSLLAMAATIGLSAQQYVVYSITGHVEIEGNNGKRALQLRDKLHPQSTIVIPYKGKVELLDEKGSKKHVLKTPGRGALSQLLADRGNTVMRLTEQYLNYMRSRVKGNGELSSRRQSDPATVTREVCEKKPDFRAEFEAFTKQAHDKYEQFRSNAIREYAEFVRKAWQEYGAQPPRPRPKDETQPPVVKPKKDRRKPKPLKSVPIRFDEKPLPAPIPVPQPTPVVPIKEQPEPEEIIECQEFMCYGTPMRVRFKGKELFRLENLTPDGIADVWMKLASADYNNTIRDCLELRIRHQLSDWAYLKMLDAFSEACFPTQRDEATLLMAYLYQQSGYKIRLGLSEGRLCMLYATRHLVYGQSYYTIGGEDFYVYKSAGERMRICEASYPKEQSLSLLISQPQMLADDMSPARELRSEQFPEMVVTSQVNKNLLSFYNDYPTSMIDANVMTRWAMYANTPLEVELSNTLIPALREKLSGKSEKDAVERLLNWVQTAFEYKYDEEVWGGDRAFFAEESLYYPYCDCEDRSILLSRLVRELIGLKTVLIYYPGHLAMAVRFNENVAGEYVQLGNDRYIVCDPTYIGAPVGDTMPGMDNKTAQVILLE